MRFIPKKKEVLIETDINPLEINHIELSYDEQYVEAITKAVASESSAIVEYEQILALEPNIKEKKLVELFHDTLIDIKDEEIKHMAQLNTKLSEVSTLKDAYKKGEEEAKTGEDEENKEQKESINLTESVNKDIKEAVPQDRTYDSDDIVQLISSKYQLTDKQYDDISDLLDPLHNYELTAEDLDRGLARVADKYEFSKEEIEEIEKLIIDNAKNPQAERKNEFQDDIDFDINTLEDMLETFNTYAAQQRIKKIIDELKSIEYNGESDIAWNPKYYDSNKHKRGLIQ